MPRRVRAVYEEGEVKFLDEPPKGSFEVVILFPDKRFKEKKRGFEPVAFGIWKSRNNMKNSSEWVRSLRKKWTSR